MKDKKQSSNWYIAATHLLTTALLAALIWFFPYAILVNEDTPAIILFSMKMFWVLLLWISVIYSAKYLSKTYIIKNSKSVAITSTAYLATLTAFGIYVGLSAGSLSLLDFIIYVIAVIGFYIQSKKYIKNNDNAITA